ncbi:hypothetical protein ElyMa_003173200 [Elysia marginata]|uniref:Uncharacterized protein n=1 Tax=Elysia marginata TaxID=1093978 RepID=A0AAV4IXL5_9GAST|nr:hypothetical protein ElyMa_003173200 [Elysia marginata]
MTPCSNVRPLVLVVFIGFYLGFYVVDPSAPREVAKSVGDSQDLTLRLGRSVPIFDSLSPSNHKGPSSVSVTDNVCPAKCWCDYGPDKMIHIVDCANKGLLDIPALPASSREDNSIMRRSIRLHFLPRLHQMGITTVFGELDFLGASEDLVSSIAGAVTSTGKTVVFLNRGIFQVGWLVV